MKRKSWLIAALGMILCGGIIGIVAYGLKKEGKQ